MLRKHERIVVGPPKCVIKYRVSHSKKNLKIYIPNLNSPYKQVKN